MGAWHVAAQEDIPDAGTEGRPLLRPIRDTVADDLRCTWPGCGDALAGSGAGRGWVLVRIVGSGDPPRRYHSGSCASRGIARVELGHHRASSAAPPAPVRQVPPTPQPPRTTAPAKPSRGAGTAALAQRIRDLGTTAKAIKAWAAANGVPCSNGPLPPGSVVDAWIEAHR